MLRRGSLIGYAENIDEARARTQRKTAEWLCMTTEGRAAVKILELNDTHGI